MPMVRVSNGGTLTYTVLNIGYLPVGGKTVDLSAYDFYQVTFCGVANPSTTNIGSWMSGLISLDGGTTADFVWVSNVTIGQMTLNSGKQITVKNAYTQTVGPCSLVILHKE